jgi:hypothetical protein
VFQARSPVFEDFRFMILVIFIVAVVLTALFWAVLLPFKPESLKVFERFVCRKDEKMEVSTSVANHHQPGEKSLEIYCRDYGKSRLVNGKTLSLAFLLSFVLTFPAAAALVILIERFMLK